MNEFDHEIAKSMECCDTPKPSISSLKWDKERERWNFDALCYSCWELCYGSIYSVEVEIRG